MVIGYSVSPGYFLAAYFSLRKNEDFPICAHVMVVAFVKFFEPLTNNYCACR